MQTKNYKNFCPTVQTRIVAPFFGDILVSVGNFFAHLNPTGTECTDLPDVWEILRISALPSNKLPGQKSLNFLDGILGETMTS